MAYPRYRYLFIASLLAGLGNSMQLLAIGWLAVDVAVRGGVPDRAPFYVGLVGLARFGPGLLFGLLGGLLADRLEKRRLLVAMRATSGLISLVLGSLVFAQVLELAVLMVLSFLATAAFAIDLPVRIAAVPGLVGRRELFSAFSLIRTTSQASLLLGPLLAGVLIVPFGVAGALLVSGVMYVASALILIGIPESRPEASARLEGAGGALVSAFAYVRRAPVILSLTLYALAYAVLVQSFNQFLPAVAHDLDVGAVELSWLVAASGCGALLGTFTVTLLGGIERMGRFVIANAFTVAILLAVFALQNSLVPALAAVAVLSVGTVTFFGVWGNLVQSHLADDLRGRVNGIHVAIFHAGMPLGTLILGTAATLVGVANALLAAATVFLLITIAATRVRSIRELQLGPRFREV